MLKLYTPIDCEFQAFPPTTSSSMQSNLEPISEEQDKDVFEPVPYNPSGEEAVHVDDLLGNLVLDQLCEPTPIGSGKIAIVEEVPVLATAWFQDFDFDLLISQLASKRKIEEECETYQPIATQSHIEFENDSYCNPTKKRRLQQASEGSASCSDATNIAPIYQKETTGLHSHDSHGDLGRATSMRLSSPMKENVTFQAEENFKLPPQQDEQWSDRFQQLLEFRKKHGHCHVSWNAFPFLAQWIKRQRYQYRLRQEGRHCTLTDEQVVALKNIGFIWDSHKAAWEERFNDLCFFKEKFGHCNVPSVYPDNHQLAVWVKSQRRQHKLFQSGKKSKITSDRIEKLNGIGFVWSLRKPK